MAEKFEEWAIVEVMGKVSYAGFVTEQLIAGCAFIRVDVSESVDAQGNVVTPSFTKFVGPNSIYCITPTTEEICKAYQKRCASRPLNVYLPEITTPKALPEPNDWDDEEDD